jgi:hypothetical protein
MILPRYWPSDVWAPARTDRATPASHLAGRLCPWVTYGRNPDLRHGGPVLPPLPAPLPAAGLAPATTSSSHEVSPRTGSSYPAITLHNSPFEQPAVSMSDMVFVSGHSRPCQAQRAAACIPYISFRPHFPSDECLPLPAPTLANANFFSLSILKFLQVETADSR